MHIWTIEKWKKSYGADYEKIRHGLSVRYEREVNPEVKRACTEFCKWLREEYFFPQRIKVYLKASPQIKAKDNEMVSATIWLPGDKLEEPFIKIAVGDYHERLQERGKDHALAGILGVIRQIKCCLIPHIICSY